MKLENFDTRLTSNKFSKLLKEHFDFTLPINSLSKDQATKMLESTQQKIEAFRNSSKFHTSERNPVYLNLIVLERALGSWLIEVGDARLCRKCKKNRVRGASDICKKCSKLDESVVSEEIAYTDTPTEDDCVCGVGSRHIYHCKRCGEPVDKNNIGIVTVDGTTHERCSSPLEIDEYMAYEGNDSGEEAIINYLKGLHEPKLNESHVNVPTILERPISAVEQYRDHLGLVVLGAGGDLKEWENGIADMLVDEGIAQQPVFQDAFKIADNIRGKHGRTDLVLIFSPEANLNVGKLAMWRLRFGSAMWLDDFLDNHSGDYLNATPEEVGVEDDLTESENISKYKRYGVFLVNIPANVYDGKYYDYRSFPYRVFKGMDGVQTSQDAINWVNTHKDIVLKYADASRMKVGDTSPRNIRRIAKPAAQNVFFKNDYMVKDAWVEFDPNGQKSKATEYSNFEEPSDDGLNFNQPIQEGIIGATTGLAKKVAYAGGEVAGAVHAGMTGKPLPTKTRQKTTVVNPYQPTVAAFGKTGKLPVEIQSLSKKVDKAKDLTLDQRLSLKYVLSSLNATHPSEFQSVQELVKNVSKKAKNKWYKPGNKATLATESKKLNEAPKLRAPKGMFRMPQQRMVPQKPHEPFMGGLGQSFGTVINALKEPTTMPANVRSLVTAINKSKYFRPQDKLILMYSATTLGILNNKEFNGIQGMVRTIIQNANSKKKQELQTAGNKTETIESPTKRMVTPEPTPTNEPPDTLPADFNNWDKVEGRKRAKGPQRYTPAAQQTNPAQSTVASDVLNALVNQGYKPAMAKNMINKAAVSDPEAVKDFDTLFRASMSKNNK